MGLATLVLGAASSWPLVEPYAIAALKRGASGG
jgi:hypothetical protein